MKIVKFENPYRELPPDARTRTTIDVSSEDIGKLQRVRPGTVLQTTINILLNKLTHELERAGLTSYAPDDYELAVAGCSISLGGIQRSSAKRPTSGKKRNSAVKTPTGDVGPGVAGVA